MEGSEEEMWKRGGERGNGTVTEIETETGAETEIGTGDTEIETGAGTDTGGGGAGAVTDTGGAGAGTETVGKACHLSPAAGYDCQLSDDLGRSPGLGEGRKARESAGRVETRSK